MRATGLTKKQLECYKAICQHFRQHGYGPTVRELQVVLSLSSGSGVHRLLLALVERGYIERRPYKGRAITLLKADNITDMLDFKNSVDNVQTLTDFLYSLDEDGKRLFIPLLRAYLAQQDAGLSPPTKEQLHGKNRGRETA